MEYEKAQNNKSQNINNEDRSTLAYPPLSPSSPRTNHPPKYNETTKILMIIFLAFLIIFSIADIFSNESFMESSCKLTEWLQNSEKKDPEKRLLLTKRSKF